MVQPAVQPGLFGGGRYTRPFQSQRIDSNHALTTLAFGLHIGGGAVGLASGTVAAFARKGGPPHRYSG